MKYYLFLIAMVASTDSLSQDKEIMWGAQTAADGSLYEIDFCARAQDKKGNPPGHAFVLLQSFDKNGKQTEFVSAGYGPPEAKPIHGRGVITPEYYTDDTQQCLIVKTNKATYDKIMSTITTATEFEFGGAKIKVESKYIVAFNDCVTFMQAIARDVGLNVPSRAEGLLPISFVVELSDRN